MQCDVHGFQHPLHPHSVQEYVRWAGEYVPIGMNTKQKKGTPLGQLISHPGNLCIKKIYLGRSIDVVQIFSRPLEATAGACYALLSNPLAILEKTLSSRSAVCSVKDLRDRTLTGVGRRMCSTMTPIVKNTFVSLQSLRPLEDVRDVRARDEV